MSTEDSNPAMHYRGRKTTRADGHARRQAILEAVLRIIERDGVRAVRHRAVALEAEVPLAATTYYFKDLNELISDAFTLFAERAWADTRLLEQDAFAALTARSSDSVQGRAQLADIISQHLLAHIRDEAGRSSKQLVEQAFRHEALRNSKLASDMQLPYNVKISLIQAFFQRLGSRDAAADAELVMASVLHWEYQLMLHGADQQVAALAERSILRLLRALFALDKHENQGI